MRRRIGEHQLVVTKSGYTLTEILVATSILAITMAAVYTSYQGGVTSWTMGTIRMERYLNARAALDMISREIQSAVLELNNSSSNIIFRGIDGAWSGGPDDELYFVAGVNHTDAAQEYDLCEIGYYLNENSSPLSSCLMRRVDDTPDNMVEEQTGASTLVSNVISLNFEYGYYDNNSGRFIFTNSQSLPAPLWDSGTDNYTTYYRPPTTGPADEKPAPGGGVDGLPHAVKVTIQVQDDQKREDPLTLSIVVYLPMSEERI